MNIRSPLLELNGSDYFLVSNVQTQTALWKTDGTSNGTQMVASFAGQSPDLPQELTVSNGKLFFSAATTLPSGDVRHELFVSDGTTAGTGPLTTFDTAGVVERNLADIDGLLFFEVSNPTKSGTDQELWTTDGTPQGTKEVFSWAKLAPNPIGIFDANGTAILVADDGVHGPELWRSDGTPGGTTVLKDLNPGTDQPEMHGFVKVQGELFFIYDDPIAGSELWKTDGTPDGTVIVKVLTPGATSPIFVAGIAVGNLLFFSNGNTGVDAQLWRSDGTEAGTQMIARQTLFNMGIAYNGRLLFMGSDSAHGQELWESNGTIAGTNLLADINRGTANSSPSGFALYNGKVYFRADDGVHGAELWQTDGTAAGTSLAADLNSRRPGSFGGPWTVLKDKLLLEDDDGYHGMELYVSDGTAAGTHLLRDINQDPTVSTAPGPIAAIGDRVIFGVSAPNVYSPGATGVWSSDGTTQDTTRISDQVLVFGATTPPPSDAPFAPVATLGGWTYFIGRRIGTDINESGFWKSDGTAADTVMLHEFDRLSGSYVVSTGGRIYFDAVNSTSGTQLWTSDGTPGDTYQLTNFPGKAILWPSNVTDVNGIVYFIWNKELFKTDGTPAGSSCHRSSRRATSGRSGRATGPTPAPAPWCRRQRSRHSRI